MSNNSTPPSMLTLESLFQHNAMVAHLRAMVNASSFLRSPSPEESSSLDDTPPTTQLPETATSSSPSSKHMTTQTQTTHTRPMPRRGRRRNTRILCPAKGSLHDILHEHAGTSLFVRPACWIDLHAQLLGARFHELSPCDTPQPTSVAGSPPSRGHMHPSRTITTLSDALTEILVPTALHPALGSNAIKTILSTLWPAPFARPQLLPELHLFFGDRVYRDAAHTQVMWNYPSDGCRSSQGSFMSVSTRPADSYGLSTPTGHNPANLPMMCYIGKKQLASMRKSGFRIAPAPGKGWNEPVIRLQQARSKKLMPANSDHDVQFVAIFLAMAQRHFYATPAPSSRRDSQWSPSRDQPPRQEFQDLKLRILTHDDDTAEFIVYTGHVTAKFLERFNEPLKNPYGEDGEIPGINMDYTRVPIWPILGLRERLGKALGQEIVGPFDPTDMETWENDGMERREAQNSAKRKRAALSEVFNGSCGEETEEEEEAEHLGAKKRCLGEGSPVGVVA
ncbi:Uncharacterized protein TCAP_07430 [Tolypocladium capitatum]|uniref:Uncharacterized protein n=1 Tax=Tolypocladium capitatum TaxID=45235 RepID=A0A2K3PYP0_9HYPO|nr:Uncharacterized protein TCAP_07430 [Tolypocladium capitatum]